MADDTKGGFFAGIPPDVFTTALTTLQTAVDRGFVTAAHNPTAAEVTLAQASLKALVSLTKEEHSAAHQTHERDVVDVVFKMLDLQHDLDALSTTGAGALPAALLALATKLDGLAAYWGA